MVIKTCGLALMVNIKDQSGLLRARRVSDDPEITKIKSLLYRAFAPMITGLDKRH
jgi:hypothetical protein